MEQSIHEGSQAQQIMRSGDQFMVALRWRCVIAAFRVRPFGRDQSPASVGKQQEQMQPVLAMKLVQNFNRLACQNMRLARDRYRVRKLAEVGSVSGGPSARFRMPSF